MDEKNNYGLNDSAFDDSDSASIIKVIGVGGGGCNAVNYMYKQNIPYVNFVVCNTDKGALDMSPIPNKLVLGYELTRGRGAGNNPELGAKCAEASAEDVRKLFDDNTEMVFITAGMGGGTGTGAAPVVARLAKEAGVLTIGIVTIPFVFEGEKKILKALDGAREMSENVDALLMINNENLVKLYPDFSLFNAMEKADDTLANAARSISEIISEDMYINVDFQDVKTVLKDAGTAIISTAYGEGDNRIADAIHNALHSPLLRKHDIKTAKRLLLKFVCNRDSAHAVQASELEAVNNFTAQLPKTIDVKWGVGHDPELGDKVKVTVLASGFDVTLSEGGNTPSTSGQMGGNRGIIFESPDHEAHKKEESLREQETSRERIAQFYGADKVIESGARTARMRYAVLRPNQLDDDEIITYVEQMPAFGRDSKFLNAINNNESPKQNAEREQEPDPGTASSNTIKF